MPSIVPIQKTVNVTVSAQPKPTASLTLTPASKPQLSLPITRQVREVHVHLASANAPPTTPFTHTQSTPAVEWSVAHPFGAEPASYLLKNAEGDVLIPHFTEYSAVRVVLVFGFPTAGSVKLWKG